MIAAGSRLADVLEAICELVERNCGGCHCSILANDGGRRQLRVFATSGLPSNLSRFAGRLASEQTAKSNRFDQRPATGSVTLLVNSHAAWQAPTIHDQETATEAMACTYLPICSSTNKILGGLAVFRRTTAETDRSEDDVIADMLRIARITIEREQREVALRHSEAAMAEAQNLSSTGSFIWHVGDENFVSSRQFRELYGFKDDGPVTIEHLCARSHPEDQASFIEMLEHGRSGRPVISCDYRIVTPDGLVRSLHAVARRVGDVSALSEYVGAIQDVTQQRSSEEALARARADLARMARVTSFDAVTASIAHEVNQPLTGIITNSGTCLRLLAAHPPHLEGARDAAQRTMRDSRRAAQIIERLRALFAGKAADLEIVDLNKAAREVIALCREDLHRQHVVLRAELADQLPPVRGDRVQIQQVVLNLLQNACDAMAETPSASKVIILRTEYGNRNMLRLSVMDTGTGLDAETQARVFEPMFTTKNNGMGMGLFISRHVAESHNGRLDVKSDNGSGATFSLSIPAFSASYEIAAGRSNGSAAAFCAADPVEAWP